MGPVLALQRKNTRRKRRAAPIREFPGKCGGAGGRRPLEQQLALRGERPERRRARGHAGGARAAAGRGGPSLDAIALQRLREENERLRGELDASRELEALRLAELGDDRGAGGGARRRRPSRAR